MFPEESEIFNQSKSLNMCAGAKFREPPPSEKVWDIYFPIPVAALPVDRGDHIEWVKWGRRNAKEDGKSFFATGWARQQAVLEGRWDKYKPEFVTLAVQAFMEKEKKETIDPLHPNRKPSRKSHWFDVEPGKAIQALIAHADNEKRLYVITVPLPEKYAWLEHDRWPSVVNVEKNIGHTFIDQSNVDIDEKTEDAEVDLLINNDEDLGSELDLLRNSKHDSQQKLF